MNESEVNDELLDELVQRLRTMPIPDPPGADAQTVENPRPNGLGWRKIAMIAVAANAACFFGWIVFRTRALNPVITREPVAIAEEKIGISQDFDPVAPLEDLESKVAILDRELASLAKSAALLNARHQANVILDSHAEWSNQ